jgi:hypothetical protein
METLIKGSRCSECFKELTKEYPPESTVEEDDKLFNLQVLLFELAKGQTLLIEAVNNLLVTK